MLVSSTFNQHIQEEIVVDSPHLSSFSDSNIILRGCVIHLEYQGEYMDSITPD